MKNIFKTVVIACALILSVNAVSAQGQGEMAAGANITIGTGNDFTNYGLTAKFQYNIIDNVRLEPSFTYFFKKDNVSNWDLSINAHYLFSVGDGFMIYPIAGVGMYGYKVSASGYSNSDSQFALNLGAGAEYEFTSQWSGCFEYKYKSISKWDDRSLFSFGVAYKF